MRTVINDFGHWIPACAGMTMLSQMTVFVNTPKFRNFLLLSIVSILFIHVKKTTGGTICHDYESC